jgi:hypothetical protein
MGPAEVSPRPGIAPDPAIRIAMGYRLPALVAWPSVEHAPADPIAITGVVPAKLRGVVWDEPARPVRSRTWRGSGAIRSEPRADAPIRAHVTLEAEIELRGRRDDWFEVTAHGPYVSVDGFIAIPPPRPPRQPTGEIETEIEGEITMPPSPLAAGTCLYDAPNGHVVGMIVGHQALDDVAPAARGWHRFALATTWGTVTYYTDATPASD